MEVFSKLDVKAKDAIQNRKSAIIASFEGRTQSYISKKTGVEQIKLNKWINSAGNLDEAELKSLSDFLGVDLK